MSAATVENIFAEDFDIKKEEIEIVSKLTGLQWVGFKIALILMGIIMIVIIGIGIYYFVNSPPVINLPVDFQQMTADEFGKYTKAIEIYQELSTASTTRAITLFETIVAKALIPILTSVLGYIYGTYNKNEVEEGSTK